jgi:enamine deaminase RidA (YjgF/YER057c/UK114 family)
MSIEILQPPHWARPKGYSAGTAGVGRQIFVSGQLGWNEHHQFPSERLCDQVSLALANVVTVLSQANARPEHVARLTWYIVDRNEYHAQAKDIGAAYREVMGRHYPAMSVVQVAALLEEAAKVEIEAIALLP